MKNNLSLDMTNPSVRRMMGTDESGIVRLSDAKGREMVQLAGDPENPRGMVSTRRLDTDKIEVLVVYKEFLLTVDVYALPGQPIELHTICPKCRHKNRITSERKTIEFDPRDERPLKLPDGSAARSGGLLSVEPFQCTWEMPDAGEHKPGIRSGGITLCQLKLAIDNNVAKDA